MRSATGVCSIVMLLVGAATASAQTTTYTDEAAFLAAISGAVRIQEGFEAADPWDAVRSSIALGTHTAPSVEHLGVTWRSNQTADGITTGGGAAVSGDWGVYSEPHGDQSVPFPTDLVHDGFEGTSTTPMTAVGGWFTGTIGGDLAIVLDGGAAISLGTIGTQAQFFGVVSNTSFTTFEFRETHGTREDQKLIFGDDFTIAGMFATASLPPDATIVQPATDVAITLGDPVVFEGSVSDPDGDAVTVVWDFGDGSSSTQLSPGEYTYIDSGTYTVTLTATDANGITDATPAMRIITVNEGITNSPPVADAGPDQSVDVGATVALDGSGSSDPDGDPLSYAWSFVSRPPASTAALDNATSMQASFTADVDGTYTIQLVVYDGLAQSSPDTVVVSTSANQPPDGTIVQPAGDVTVNAGDQVQFEGSVQDPDGDEVTVLWAFGDGTTSTALVPGGHTYSTAGTYQVSLTATDSRGAVDPTPATRQITVEGTAIAAMDGVVSGVADIRGFVGSDWHTDLYLHNVSGADVVVELFFSPSGGQPGAAVTRTVGADHTVVLADVVSSVFGEQGSGAVFWRVVGGDPGALLVNANTYNRVDDVRRYGQQVPGFRWADQPPAGTPLEVPALAGTYRTNLGIATDGDCTQAIVRAYDRGGVLKAERTINVSPNGWKQLNKLFTSEFPGLLSNPSTVPVGDSLHRFEVEGVDGKVVVYASIVDNVSSDGSYLVALPAGALAGQAWLAGAAFLSGANQSQWRSDVITFNMAGAADSATVTYLPSESDNSGALDSQSLALAADGGLFLGNVLHDSFGLYPPAVGTLGASATDSLFWMRTYTEESSPGGGLMTYGQAIPALARDDAIPAGGEGRVFGFTEDDRTRSNLILQNMCSDGGGQLGAVTVDVQVLDQQGTAVTTESYPLLPGEYFQDNRFLKRLGLGWMTGAAVAVRPQDAGSCAQGGVFAMVSEVNGSSLAGTNDARLIGARVVSGR